MALHRMVLPAILVVAYVLFVLSAKSLSTTHLRASEVDGSVVLPPILQTALYLGDRYLAANIESMRVLATGGDLTGSYTDYYHRLHRGVSMLNPCHEDNYYIANALLAWAGGIDTALDILGKATDCRFWDAMPPFYLGYNRYFFMHDFVGARQMLNRAADRSEENRAAFERIGIVFEAEGYPDVKTAHAFLVQQREQARDPKLRDALGQRIGRLDGLIALNDAQEAFERRYRRKLENPQDLLSAGVLAAIPMDPMRLGYEFSNGRFSLKQLKVRGVERPHK